MTAPATAREALIVEALGETAKLIRQMEMLAPLLDGSCQALLQADSHLRHTLSGFEARMAAISETAKIRTVQHLEARVDEVTRRSMEQQGKAMSDAARVAFSAEVGPTIQRLRSTLQPLIEKHEHPWESWLTHTAAAFVAAAATWAWALTLVPH